MHVHGIVCCLEWVLFAAMYTLLCSSLARLYLPTYIAATAAIPTSLPVPSLLPAWPSPALPSHTPFLLCMSAAFYSYIETLLCLIRLMP